MYLFLLLTVAILTGSGVIGNSQFLIALLIVMVLCCIGVNKAFSSDDTKDNKGGDDDKRF